MEGVDASRILSTYSLRIDMAGLRVNPKVLRVNPKVSK